MNIQSLSFHFHHFIFAISFKDLVDECLASTWVKFSMIPSIQVLIMQSKICIMIVLWKQLFVHAKSRFYLWLHKYSHKASIFFKPEKYNRQQAVLYYHGLIFGSDLDHENANLLGQQKKKCSANLLHEYFLFSFLKKKHFIKKKFITKLLILCIYAP